MEPGTSPDEVSYDVILLAGQSNMSGRGMEYDLAGLDSVDPRIFQYGNTGVAEYAHVISQAVEPLNMLDVPRGMGPGLVFARWYSMHAEINRRILLVPAAHGNTPLVSDRPPTWRPDIPDSLCAMAIAHTMAAMKAAGRNVCLRAVLWVQGETDALNDVTSDLYRQQLDLLIAGLRAAFQQPTLPFVIGQMVPDFLTVGSAMALNQVHVDTPRRVLHTGFAYGPIGPEFNNGDRAHYNAKGQRQLGRALFDAYLLALANVSGVAPQPPPRVIAVRSASQEVRAIWERPLCRVTDYSVRYSTDGGAEWCALRRAASIDNAAVIDTRASRAAEIVVEVAARNEIGTSEWSIASEPVSLVSPSGLGMSAWGQYGDAHRSLGK
jgi:Carbohydrate esterase, sialic acid-specific acetylesterase